MDVCSVCLQATECERLTRRDLSAFYAVCNMSRANTEKETYVWVCAYCWKRTSQCLKFIELARRSEFVLNKNAGHVNMKPEDFHPYSTVRLDSVRICEARECLTTNDTIIRHQAEHRDNVFISAPLCEAEMDIKLKIEADILTDCDYIKEESVPSPTKSLSPNTESYSPIQRNPSTSSVVQQKEIDKPADTQLPVFVMSQHVKTDLLMNQHNQEMKKFYQLRQKRNNNIKRRNNFFHQKGQQMDLHNQFIDQPINEQQIYIRSKKIVQRNNLIDQQNQQIDLQITLVDQPIKRNKTKQIQEQLYNATDSRDHEQKIYKRRLHFVKIAPKHDLTVDTKAHTSLILDTISETRDIEINTEQTLYTVGDTVLEDLPINFTQLPSIRNYVLEADRAIELGMELVELTLEQQEEEIDEKKQNKKYKEKKYKCEKCGVAFHDEESFILHVEKRHDESVGAHACTVCGYRYKSAGLLALHAVDHARRWRCTRCSQVIPKMIWLTHHDRCAPHDEGVQYPCNVCGKIYKTELRLKKHIWVWHKPERLTLLCDICNKTFTNKHALRNHMRIHVNLRPHKCVTCGKTFTTRALLKSHIRKHDEPAEPKEVRYCVECDKYFKTKYNLDCHLASNRKHVVDLMNKCSLCSENFMTKNSLEYHTKAVHLNTRDFPCNRCDKAYCSERVLRAHIKRKHSQIERTRDHPCSMCSSEFYDQKTLKEHTIAVHERRRPHECEICGEKFGFKGALYTHRKLKHKIRGHSAKKSNALHAS